MYVLPTCVSWVCVGTQLLSPVQLFCNAMCYSLSLFQGIVSVKKLPAMQETWVRSLGWQDPLEEKMATHSRILAWKIPWTEELGRLQSMGSQRIGHN